VIGRRLRKGLWLVADERLIARCQILLATLA
jgi:hypothetical protein